MSGGAPFPVAVNEKILCISDLKEAGSKRLTPEARGNVVSGLRGVANNLSPDFYNSGSTEQVTINENSVAYSKYRVRPRVLVDVSKCDTTTEVFGQKIAFPLSVSPTGLQSMAHPDGELATSRACAKAGVNMGISSYTNHTIEQIREAGLSVGPVNHAMQLYTMRDRDLELRIIREAEGRGCKAIFLTADSPVLGVRFNEWRNDFRTPPGFGFPMLELTSEKIRSTSHDSTFLAFNDDSHHWTRDIPWLRSVTKMEIWIKGVLTAEDTLKAIEMGCDGVLVSNHGGRQFDGVPATLDALPECVEAAAGRIPIHVDGGVRTGTDIFKALALGAECVWVGRPTLWGLAYDGQKGVELMLKTFYSEFKRCMQLTGCNSVKDINRACLGVARPDGPLARL